MTRFLLLFLASLFAAGQSHAACSGGTLEEEYREADVVVRARMTSEINAHDDAPSATYRRRWGNGAPVVLYGLRMIAASIVLALVLISVMLWNAGVQ